MICIRHSAPISLTVYAPETPETQARLAKQVSELHAAAVIQRIKTLPCPSVQKQQLLESVLDTVKAGSRDQT